MPVRYYEGGAGEPLVFLHGAGGLDLDMTRSSTRWRENFHVYAPLVPGYGDSEECAELRDMLDFTLHTWDVVDALGARGSDPGGLLDGRHDRGEMAAIAPRDVSRLALIAPAGLWMDAHPIPDIFSMLPFELASVLFYDAEIGAQVMSVGSATSAIRNSCRAFLVHNARQLGAAGKILFPIPERGLRAGLYRIKARTVIVWGENDKLIPSPTRKNSGPASRAPSSSPSGRPRTWCRSNRPRR